MGSAADGPLRTGASIEGTPDAVPAASRPSPDVSTGATGASASHPPDGGAPVPDSADSTAEDVESKRISPIPEGEVIELFNALEKTVRARRLYQDNNPVYQNFLRALHDISARVFSLGASLTVNVEEHGLRWYGQLIETGSGRENLAFLFYKDGVRQLTFLDGFQDELDRFLSVVHRARLADQQGDDDMVTLLWEEEFTCFQYSYVDALAEGLDVPQAPPPVVGADDESSRIDPAVIQQEIATGGPLEEQSPMVQAGMPSVASSISREDFQETLYFLEPDEMQVLQREVEREWTRDTKRDVLNALFDRLEDRIPEWQDEILRILRQMLPAFLSRGDLRSATYVLTELHATAGGDVLNESAQREAERLFAEVSEPAVVGQLLRSIEEGAIQPDPADLGAFLTHLGPRALPLLLHAVESTTSQPVQARLQKAVETLARDHQQEIVRLLSSGESSVAAGAARLAGRIGIGDAVPGIVALLQRADAPARRTAVEALISIRNAAALDALQNTIDDEDRDVRLAALRGLGSLRYAPARQRLEKALDSKLVRDADLTEKMAFFEAFGAVATADNIDMLDRMLNGRKLFARTTPELRACAALALGKINAPAARTALEQAATDQQPIVRNAVLKALRREQGGAP